MEFMQLKTTTNNNNKRLPMDTSQLFVSIYKDLEFMVENAYGEQLQTFLNENKSKIDLQYRFDDDSTVIMKTVLGAQKVDLLKETALESVKKYEVALKTLHEFGFGLNDQDKYGNTALHWSVMIQNPYILRWLIKLGADTTIQDEDGQTVLHLAIRIGFADGISVIVDSAPRELLELTSRVSGATPLIYATQLGNRELVDQLLSAGCNPNTQETNKYKRAALHYAFFFDHDEIFDLLLQRGADINVADYKQKGMLQRAAAHTDGRYLQSIVDNSGRAPTDGVTDQLRRTLSERGINGMTPLMAAAGAESGDNVELLCRIVKDQVFELDNANRCALHYCSRNRELRCLQLIYELGPDMLETKDENGVTPLMQSVLDGNVDVARYLLQQGANILVKDRELHTVAHSATVSGSPEIVDLISFYNADLSQPDVYHTYPLHYAVRLSTEAGTVEQRRDAHKIINKLIAKGVPVNCVDEDQRQPLFWAASAGDERTCTILTNAGADVNSANKDGLTALHCAASKGFAKLTELLIVESNAMVDFEDKWGCTPLFYAITNQHLTCAQLLVKHGANPNHMDFKGRTPAHCACAVTFFDGVSLLKESGADFSAKNQRGELPIHEATRQGHRDVVAYLLELGLSKPNPKLKDGKTPLHQAVEQHDQDLAERLLAQGANVNAVMFDIPTKQSATARPAEPPASLQGSRREMKDSAAAKNAKQPQSGAVTGSNTEKTAATETAVAAPLAIETPQSVLKLEEIGRTPLDIAIRDGYKMLIELLKHHGGARATKVILWNTRIIQKYFRGYQAHKRMLKEEEEARIAAEAELRDLEEQRRKREEEERRRLEKEFADEMERRRAERALYEFSLDDVQRAAKAGDSKKSAIDGDLKTKVAEYHRQYADEVMLSHERRKHEMEAKHRKSARRRALFDGDKPPTIPFLPQRGSAIKSATGSRTAESASSHSGEAAPAPAAQTTVSINRGNVAAKNPPPGWFVRKSSDDTDKRPGSPQAATRRTEEIRESVARFDMARRATSAYHTLKRAQFRNMADNKMVEQLTKTLEIDRPAAPAAENRNRESKQAEDDAPNSNKRTRENAPKSASSYHSSRYSEYASTYSYYTHTDMSRSLSDSSDNQSKPRGPNVEHSRSPSPQPKTKQPRDIKSVRELESYLNGQIRELGHSSKPAARNRVATGVSRTSVPASGKTPRPESSRVKSASLQHEQVLQQKKQLRKELKELVINTKLLFNDTHDDADNFLEKVGQRNKAEEARIKQLLIEKRHDDLVRSRQTDGVSGPRATLENNATQGAKLLDKRVVGPRKSALKRTDSRKTEERSGRNSIPSINRHGSIVSARSDERATSAYSDASLAESLVELPDSGSKDANGKGWIKSYDGRYRKRRPLVITLPENYLELQDKAAEKRNPSQQVAAN